MNLDHGYTLKLPGKLKKKKNSNSSLDADLIGVAWDLIILIFKGCLVTLMFS